MLVYFVDSSPIFLKHLLLYIEKAIFGSKVGLKRLREKFN